MTAAGRPVLGSSPTWRDRTVEDEQNTAAVIRTAVPDDREAILAVVRDAFSGDGRDGSEEIEIVQSTWSLDAVPDGLELVAVEGGAVLGHVLGAVGDLDGREVVGIVPLAVAPGHQGQGVGRVLMTELLRRPARPACRSWSCSATPCMMGGTGSSLRDRSAFVIQPVGAGNPSFQVCRLPRYDPAYRGSFTYCWEAAAE